MVPGTDDGLKEAMQAIARGALPEFPYSHMHRAKMVRQLPTLKRVDVVPDDPMLPPMANIPLKVGIPGVDVTIPVGHFLMVGWEDARPDRPFACLWTPGKDGTIPLKVAINAQFVELGGDGIKPLIPVIDGVVTGQGIDPFTRMPYAMLGATSPFVSAKKLA